VKKKRPTQKTCIIGLTGNIAGGKGIIGELLKKNGYEYFSLSSQVRAIAKKRGEENAARAVLQNIGNEMRSNFGADILARLVGAEIFASANNLTVIDGIRNPGEIEFFRRRHEFLLIAVTAPEKDRFERMLARNRPSDPKTWEDFLLMDERDLGKGESASGQQVGACIEMADFILPNNWSVESLEKRTIMVLESLRVKKNA